MPYKKIMTACWQPGRVLLCDDGKRQWVAVERMSKMTGAGFLKSEVQIFFWALMAYTRIPCPDFVGYAEKRLDQSSRYFPLVGLLVGAVAAAVFQGAVVFVPLSVAVLLSMVSSVWLTGAFHEDGLTDFVDGFGGGRQKADILRIMKDSRVGVYGMLGLGLVVALKFLCLNAIALERLALTMIAGHTLSRFFAGSFMATLPYVQEDRKSKVKALTTRMSLGNLALSAIWCPIPLLAMADHRVLYVVSLLLPVRWFMNRYLKQRLGGYTGDCLGAAQQIFEIVFYLGVVAVMG